MVRFTVPTCDYLTVTTPSDPGGLIANNLLSLLSDLPGLTCVRPRQWRVASYDGSLFSIFRRGRVVIFTASGGALQALRDHNLFSEYLSTLASEGAHRVTRLDVALDIAKEASKTVVSLYRKGINNPKAFHLGKKAAPVRNHHSLSKITGLETGTTYFGGRSAEITARVYDKREEQVTFQRKPDPGPMLRYELTVTNKVFPTLRDAYEPEALFWHFMAPDILKKPSGVKNWEPHGEGFSTTVSSRNPLERLARRLEHSPEFADLCATVRNLPQGVFILCQHLATQGITVRPTNKTGLDPKKQHLLNRSTSF